MWSSPPYKGPERRRVPRWRPRPLRVLVLLLAFAAAAYMVGVLWIISQETRMVFQAVQTLGEGRPPFEYEQIDLPRPDGARQFAWVMPAEDAQAGLWALYLHGNPSTIASQVNIAHYELLRDLGLSVFAPEYRGFAGLDGVPSEASLGEDARAAYEYLRTARGIAASRIVIYGWSLGGAVAVGLASGSPAAALVLEGTPASVVDLTASRYPFFPIHLLMRSRFDAAGRIGKVGCPVLVLHSPGDPIVPIAEGRRLFEHAPGPKEFVEINGGHVDAAEIDRGRITRSIRLFLDAHLKL